MTYRVQIDCSFLSKEDADNFQEYVKSLSDKLYFPEEEEMNSRPDLFTAPRMHIIKDYDDEGNNKPGETISWITICEEKRTA